MSLFPSRVRSPLAAGKVIITFINVSFVSTILAKGCGGGEGAEKEFQISEASCPIIFGQDCSLRKLVN